MRFIKFILWCSRQWRWYKIQTPLAPKGTWPHRNPIFVGLGEEEGKKLNIKNYSGRPIVFDDENYGVIKIGPNRH